jgi:hypothetical protein
VHRSTISVALSSQLGIRQFLPATSKYFFIICSQAGSACAPSAPASPLQQLRAHLRRQPPAAIPLPVRSAPARGRQLKVVGVAAMDTDWEEF